MGDGKWQAAHRSGGTGYTTRQLNKAFGKPGKPRTIEQAMKEANPMYAARTPEYTRNCQRCVYAYEMLRRGYNVEARECKFDGTDTLPYWYGPNGGGFVMEGQQTETFPSRGTKQKLLDKMAEWGDGARAIVRVRWKSGGGHVFMAEQTKDGTVFVDPQNGNYVNLDSYLSQAVKKDTYLSRIDNLKPRQLIEEAVRKGP